MDEQGSGIQLEMNFNTPSGNRFRRCLENGVFTVLFEQTAPGMELPDEEAAARLAVMEKTALSFRDLPCALALTDRYWSDKHRRAIDYAALLPEKSRNSHLIYLSGRQTDLNGINGLLAEAANLHLANLVVVSGGRRLEENAKDLRKLDFTESVTALRNIQSAVGKDFYPGSVINCHHYSAPGLYSSIFKLIKKFNNGAEFAVTQAGFDMAQLDNLRTYLSWRGYNQPLIARLMLMTPDKVDKITTRALTGINVSRDFLNILNRELRFSESQFSAAQYRRLELQAAGCKLLGFNGVQICGIDSADKMRITMERISRALKEFTTLAHWLDEYKFFMARSDMAPGEKDFYLFEKLLSSTPEERAVPQVTEFALPPVGFVQHCKERARSFFFPEADRQDPNQRRGLKKLLTGCPGCTQCRLPQTEFHCVERCPKGMANGPCGEVCDNDMCEAGNFRCVHLDIWYSAERNKHCDRLENNFIPQK